MHAMVSISTLSTDQQIIHHHMFTSRLASGQLVTAPTPESHHPAQLTLCRKTLDAAQVSAAHGMRLMQQRP